MSTEHEGVDRSPEAGRADETAPADRVPQEAPQESSTTQLRKIDPAEEPPAAPGPPPPAGHPGPWGVPTPPPAPAGPPPPPYGGPGQPWGAPIPPPPPPERRRGGLIAAALAVALIAGGVGGGIGFWAADRNNAPSSDTITAPSGPKSVSRAPDSVAGIAAKALPSVATIQTNGGGRGGTGTGFVFDKQGHILTNNHVVASAADGGRLTTVFSDGKKYAAEVVGRAQGYDVAVIKLKNPGDRKLKPVPLGKSDEVAVGDPTIAIGAPYGLSGTVTTGIVSALNRPVASSDGEGSKASYMSALQTDASINPGNSGGPLLNAKGAVIGVNSAIQSASDGLGGGSAGSIGLGFAIPIDQAKRVAQTLIETGRPVYPVIGATVDMTKQGQGATISARAADGTGSVVPGGPADKAGLKPGDVITRMDGTAIDSGPTLISEIWTHEPGEKVKVTYERNGKKATTEITLGKRTGDD
ncbi:S1C family serine protease [Streptomyces gobiensis]|uniref:S1C family serine protease n=1 Tax=Streptomyces gobiensis TaxID=2875706 RepID=UPI001E61F97B|nr:trypsin-like peptidase domain-containing protein [Streptomyces gobiensis]UGY92470.1 trypsin-like peptidase domain-containing protein [Streptomyces gobiensis]